MAMKPEFKKVLVDALRSGEFKQGRRTLKTGDGSYCCLGVACVAWQSLLPDLRIKETGGSFDRMCIEFKGRSGTYLLPEALTTEVGMARSVQTTLSNMNDDEGKTFAEIADYIEANL